MTLIYTNQVKLIQSHSVDTKVENKITIVLCRLTSHKSMSNLCSISDRFVDKGTAPTKW